MSKQTAVEWLVEQVNADCLNSTFIRKELIDQANAMFEEQMKEAALRDVTRIPPFRKIFEEQFEKYYNETYKGGEE